MVVKSDTSRAVQSQLDSILDNHKKADKSPEVKAEKREYGYPGDAVLDTTGSTAAIAFLNSISGNRGGGYGGGYGRR